MKYTNKKHYSRNLPKIACKEICFEFASIRAVLFWEFFEHEGLSMFSELRVFWKGILYFLQNVSLKFVLASCQNPSEY